jgi:hypothetical protein
MHDEVLTDQANENGLATKVDIQGLDKHLSILDAKLTMVQWIVSGVGFGIIILMIGSFLR